MVKFCYLVHTIWVVSSWRRLSDQLSRIGDGIVFTLKARDGSLIIKNASEGWLPYNKECRVFTVPSPMRAGEEILVTTFNSMDKQAGSF